MLTPTYPKIVPDRDQFNDWYLDEPVTIHLQNGHILKLDKGFRFDSHSVPFVFRLIFPRYVKTDTEVNDVYAALVHDALIALDHWHRYNRKFEDQEYKRFHDMEEYQISKFRAYWMPLAVRFAGWLKYDIWGDNRGIPKKQTKVEVKITHI